MKVFGRQDALLIGALATALILVFSPQISRLLEGVRGLEQQTGLALIPALVVMTGALVFHLYHRSHQRRTREEVATLAATAAAHQAEELDRLVMLGQSLGRALDFDSIRVAVIQHLPPIAGTESVWVLVQHGADWQALAGDTRGAEDVIPWGELARQLLAPAGERAPGSHVEPADRAIGFPLIVGGTALGVLGVRPKDGVLADDRRRLIEAAASLLAVSIKNAQLFRDVKENSVKDPLTGCFTRNHALEVVDAELRRARRSQTPVSLIMFDLDRFRDLNDRYGHLAGDAVLNAVGTRMKEVLRGSDLKCRYGGEEFLVLLPETPLHGARRVAETLRREIAERPVPWSGEGLTITASFGLAQTVPGEVNVQSVIARADQALYRAKDAGRNCVHTAAEPAPIAAAESTPQNPVT